MNKLKNITSTKNTRNELNELNEFLNANNNVISNENQNIINEFKSIFEGLTFKIKELITKSKESKESYEELIKSINTLNTNVRSKLNSFTKNTENTKNTKNTELKEIYQEIVNHKTDKEIHNNTLDLKKERTMIIARIKKIILNIDNEIKIREEKQSKRNLTLNIDKRDFIKNIKKNTNIGSNQTFDSKSIKVISELNIIKRKYLKLFDYCSVSFKKFSDDDIIQNEFNIILFKLKKDFKIYIIDYYINKYEKLFPKNGNIKFENTSDSSILKVLLEIKDNISKLDTDLSYLKTIITNNNNKNIKDYLNKLNIVYVELNKYLKNSINKLKEKLTIDISEINKTIGDHINQIINLIENFNKIHNISNIYDTSKLKSYQNELNNASKKQIYIDKLKEVGQGLNFENDNENKNNTNNSIDSIDSNNNIISIDSSSNINNFNVNTTEESNGNTKKVLNLKNNDIVSWRSQRNSKIKYGLILGPSSNNDIKSKQVQTIILNNKRHHRFTQDIFNKKITDLIKIGQLKEGKRDEISFLKENFNP